MSNKTPQRLIIVPLLIFALVILQFAISSPNVGAFASVGNGIKSILPSLAGPEVDTLNDEADGSCADGDCSLRDAIATASPGDTITFSVNGTIYLKPSLGELLISQNLTIDGGGKITVSGDEGNDDVDKVRVFNVTGGNVTFENLTIEKGKFTGAVLKCGIASDKGGGGILNDGANVTVKNSTLSDNTADCGGAILNDGTLTVENSTLDNNTADYGSGGAIDNRSGKTTTITDSTLANNTAVQNGGAIGNFGTVNVTRSTLNGNEATSWGGGIYNQWVVNINNSTFSDNVAPEGGGLHSYCYDDVQINNSTFSENRAKNSDGGGGIVSDGSGCTSAETTISNTIVSGNVKDGSSTADDLALQDGTSNTFKSDGYNLVGTMGSGITFTGTGDQTNENDPKLESLANNGGDTKTHALQAGSLAINNGNCSSGPATDQRGVARPQDDTCDIGAYEKELPPAPVADFSGTPTSGTKPLEVDFSDESKGDVSSYAWDFGDGNSSTGQNPKHTYNTAGKYTVELTVTGPGGSDTKTRTDYIEVSDPAQPPVAAFSGTPTSGTQPLEVDFSDESTGDVSSYAWDFGDGNSSTQQNPKHTYNTAGKYTVELTVTGPGGSDTETKTDYIDVSDPGQPPVAEFSGSPTSGSVPLVVIFSNSSTGDISSYSWDFGDGESSTDTNPSHTYTTEGSYTVSLTVSGPGGSDSETKSNYIAVDDPPCLVEVTNNQSSGPGSLRDAIAKVCVAGLITFDEGLANSTIDISPDGELLLDKIVTIASTVPITISGNKQVRVFRVTARNVTLDGLTIADGKSLGNGGGILDEAGYLMVANSIVRDNAADHGGGIFSKGPLTMTHSELLRNVAKFGGGIAYENPLENSNSLAKENASQDSNSIFHWLGFELTDTKFIENKADDDGGGLLSWTIVSVEGFATQTIVNPIWLRNHAEKHGGAFSITNSICSYDADTYGGSVPLTIKFSNSHPQLTTCDGTWDFGDGNSSTEKNPSHTYTTPGNYTVKFTLSNSFKHTERSINAYTVGQPPVADFRFDATSAYVDSDISFFDRSSGEISSWLWDFGDGITSTDSNPSISFFYPGCYTPTLKVSGPGGSSTKVNDKEICIASTPPIWADFDFTPKSGFAPLDVHFNDKSEGDISSYSWNWGNGGAYSGTNSNPTATYSEPGCYSPSLIVHGSDGDVDIKTVSECILVSDPTRSSVGFAGSVTSAGGSAEIGYHVPPTSDIASGSAQWEAAVKRIQASGGITVTVSNGTFSGNSAQSGGAINNQGTNLMIENSTLSDNSATEDGGGINSGSVDNPGSNLMIKKSTFTGNSAKNGGGVRIVPEIYFLEDVGFHDNAALEIGGANDVTFKSIDTSDAEILMLNVDGFRNSGGSGGFMGTLTTTGGLLTTNSAVHGTGRDVNAGPSIVMRNSTISDNSAQLGGAIYNQCVDIKVDNSTISNNQAASGGGIASQGNELTTTILGNTIVANNVISDTITADDLALFDGTTDSFSSEGYNLIGIMGPNIVFDGTGDLTNVADPKLGPLADNGGDTLTHALLPGSPAIDAGGDCDEPFDQRGVPRPQGPACDIGGYELIVEGYRIALPVILGK